MKALAATGLFIVLPACSVPAAPAPPTPAPSLTISRNRASDWRIVCPPPASPAVNWAPCLGPVQIDTGAALRFISVVSTVVEIKAAIEKLSPGERAELEALVWPDWDRPEGDDPPGVREKLAQAAEGRFQPGNRSNIQKILSSLE